MATIQLPHWSTDISQPGSTGSTSELAILIRGGQYNGGQDSTENIKGIRSMYQAAFRGDWPAAERLLEEDPTLACVELTEKGDRALHIAAATKQTKFVRQLVRRMKPEDLSMLNGSGYTAFCYAAASGIVEMAAVMMAKNRGVVTIFGANGMMPIYMAATRGHEDMVLYLYRSTPLKEYLTAEKQFDLLLATIRKYMYGVALDILNKNESLATMTSEDGTALHLLAQHDISDISATQEKFLSLVSMFPDVLGFYGLKRYCEQTFMRKRARLLAERLWDKIQTLGKEEFDRIISEPPILHDAAKVGNVGFITMVIRTNPHLIWETDSNGRTIFHVAVLYRQENVFSLIHHHQIGAMKDLLAIDLDSKLDSEGDNILHLAGKLAHPSMRKTVAGAALQMQRELMWFKEVEKTVRYPSVWSLHSNKENGYELKELFSEHHKELLTQGETWIKKTAESCMFTATLIATVVFAAAFTVPGGTDDATGIPILLNKALFRTFVASDGAAMFFSTFSIIMFLAILTSRYEEKDFLVSLPRKLSLGLTALFASIVSTIFAFTSTCFLLFTRKWAWFSTLTAIVACFSLAILFVVVHAKLWIDTVRSTYWSGSLFRPIKRNLY